MFRRTADSVPQPVERIFPGIGRHCLEASHSRTYAARRGSLPASPSMSSLRQPRKEAGRLFCASHVACRRTPFTSKIEIRRLRTGKYEMGQRIPPVEPVCTDEAGRQEQRARNAQSVKNRLGRQDVVGGPIVERHRGRVRRQFSGFQAGDQFLHRNRRPFRLQHFHLLPKPLGRNAQARRVECRLRHPVVHQDQRGLSPLQTEAPGPPHGAPGQTAQAGDGLTGHESPGCRS
ncbi:hypothetical protein [Altericroceibacterium xinjiangense]|uniref:hypothetical protein n=1 Tax=Altericroceibacterium xinjiangense TaxID=762261 RepID=UPI0019D2E2EC|nr:hypothetical protein [Altericroceibacterium xinjiangense]